MLTGLSSRGFTLVELMVVITIIGILMLIGVPEFRTWQANAQIRSVAEALQNDLRQTRAEAVRRNRQVALVLTDDTPVGNAEFDAKSAARNWVVLSLPLLDGDEGDNETSGSTGFVTNYAQGNDSKVQVTGSRKAICFNSVGRLTARDRIGNAKGESCTAAAFDFDVKRTDFANDNTNIRRLRIQVRPGGQVRMCDVQKTSPAPDACQS